MSHPFSVWLAIMGVLYVVISYFHIIKIVEPTLYPGGIREYTFRICVEYGFGYFAMIQVLYNYLHASIMNPHSPQVKDDKLNSASFKRLIEINENERKRREFDKITKEYGPLSENRDEFVDNFGFGLYCDRCKKNRFPRSHHWSGWRQWTALMDHHWLFINNCVGYANVKYFLRFTWWGSLLGFYYIYMCSGFTIQYLSNLSFWLMTGQILKISPIEMFLILWMQIITIISIMLVFFFTVVFNRLSKGQTGLEYFKNSDDWAYDLGYDTNWELAFGRRKCNFFFFSFFKNIM